MPFILLGIHGAINTAYFRSKKEQLPSYVSSCFAISITSSFIILISFFLFKPLIQAHFDIPSIWLMVIPLICLFQTFTSVTLVLFQARKMPVQYGVYQISLSLLNFCLSVLLVVHFKMGWEGRILAILLSFFTFVFVGLYILRKNRFLSRKISKAHIKDALKFGVPLIPHTISGPIVQMADRLIITAFIGLSAVGVYSAAFQIASVVTYASMAFSQAWGPHLFENLKEITEAKKIKLVKQSYLFMGAFLLMPLLILLLRPLIFNILIHNPQYSEAKDFVFNIAVGAAFGGMYYTVANYIFYEKKTYLLAIITFISALLSVGLNLFFIPRYGTIGASYSYIIVNIYIFIAVWILANKVFPMPWFYFLKRKKINQDI
jgi:O-antigen/teichoic acid export membrane protein